MERVYLNLPLRPRPWGPQVPVILRGPGEEVVSQSLSPALRNNPGHCWLWKVMGLQMGSPGGNKDGGIDLVQPELQPGAPLRLFN